MGTQNRTLLHLHDMQSALTTCQTDGMQPALTTCQTDGGQRKPRTAYALRHWQSTMTAMQPCASSWQVSGTVQHRDLGAHQSHAAALRKGGLRGVQRVADHGGAAAAGCPGWLRQPVAHISTLSHDCKCNMSGRLPTVELLQPLHSRLSKDPTAPCISTHLHWCVRPAILAD